MGGSTCMRGQPWAALLLSVLLAGVVGSAGAFAVPCTTRPSTVGFGGRGSAFGGCQVVVGHSRGVAPSLQWAQEQQEQRRRPQGTTMVVGLGSGRRVLATALASTAALASMGGGVLAGGLHAISGPDHLAALLPRIMGKAWPTAMRIGAVWGLGHGFSATLIGLAAFFLKDRLRAGGGGGGRWVAALGTYTEALVGVSLITIGLIGLKESLLEPPHVDKEAEAEVKSGRGTSQKAIFLNGLLHGFSWDGAPSLAPALACTTWHGVLWFLLAYCGGTMAAMSAATSIIGEGSVRVGQALDAPDVPRRLSVASSGVAIAIGALWLIKAFFF